MPPVPDGFTLGGTHGILARPGVKVLASSDDRSWPAVYASLQHETPFEASFSAVDDQLIVLHLDSLVRVHRQLSRGDANRIIAPGGLFMVPGGMDFSVRVDGGLHTLHVYLRRALLEEVAATLLPGDPAHLEILPLFGDTDPLIERLLHGVRDALSEDNAWSLPCVDYLARAVAARLIHRHSSASPPAPINDRRQAIPPRQLAKAIEFMEAHLTQSIGLPAMAAATGLSPSHFARQFRLMTGKAPHQYLLQLRLARSEQLLRDTDTSIVEIAYACGFASQEHLTRMLKRSRGVTPAAYRKATRA